MQQKEEFECNFCGQKFESKHEEGVHRAEEHVETDSNITKRKANHDPKKSIINSWK